MSEGTVTWKQHPNQVAGMQALLFPYVRKPWAVMLSMNQLDFYCEASHYNQETTSRDTTT